MNCYELEEALASEDPAAVAAARDHAAHCPMCRAELQLWDDLSAAARTLHREWDSPALWPRIVSAIRDRDDASRARHLWGAWWPRAQWRALAAVLVFLVLIPSAWYGWRLLRPAAPSSDLARTSERLLNEQALAEVERAEADYIRAIDRLSSVAAAAADTSASPLLLNLHERLTTIDAAIAECRAEIERNRFNAHLRNQLLLIYRQKQHTLEQILEQEKHAS
ncbi:MAG: hypothetical protein ACRD2X_11990 [Vicinamibacteraceae bacterium]